jgi:hypothetical protein
MGNVNAVVDDLRDHRFMVDHLPIDTRAGGIGGFTPLARGVPNFYTGIGDNTISNLSPIRFRDI